MRERVSVVRAGGALEVVNRGDDADTTGAALGQIAGACYGESAVPADWRGHFALGGSIRELAVAAHALIAS